MAEKRPVSDHVYLSFNRCVAKVKSFATASRPKSTIVKVELEVTNAWELQDILRQLHGIQHPGQDEIQ